MSPRAERKEAKGSEHMRMLAQATEDISIGDVVTVEVDPKTGKTTCRKYRQEDNTMACPNCHSPHVDVFLDLPFTRKCITCGHTFNLGGNMIKKIIQVPETGYITGLYLDVPYNPLEGVTLKVEVVRKIVRVGWRHIWDIFLEVVFHKVKWEKVTTDMPIIEGDKLTVQISKEEP